MSYAERIGAIRHDGNAMVEALLRAAQVAAEADDEISALKSANRDLQAWFDAAFSEFQRKDAEIASLREELARVIDPARAIAAHAADAMTAKDMVIGALLDTLRQWKYAEDNNDRDELANARTNRDEVLAQVAEVGR